MTPRAFVWSALHARRLEENGLRRPAVTLGGLYAATEIHGLADTVDLRNRETTEQVVLFVGRLIPEKRADLPPEVVAAVLGPGLRRAGSSSATALSVGSRTSHRSAGMGGIVEAAGFVESSTVDKSMASAACLLVPTIREGYGIVVVDAAAHGTPVVVVAGEDNAAADLIIDGVNGYVVHDDGPEAIASAVVAVLDGGVELRQRTRQWFEDHEVSLSASTAGRAVAEYYRSRVEYDLIPPA